MKSITKELELIKKGYKIHKTEKSELSAVQKANEMKVKGYDVVILDKDNKKVIWVKYKTINVVSFDIPQWSKSLPGNRERKAFCIQNKIPFDATSNDALDKAIEIWKANK